MKEVIKSLLKDHQRLHSDFQIKNFIIGCTGDAWARYKQCLREIESRYEIFLKECQELKVEKSRIESLKDSINYNAKNKTVYYHKIRSYNKKLSNAKDIKRELKKFIEIATRLKDKIGEIDSKKRNELESKSWKNKALKMAALDVISTGRVSVQTLEFIFSFPDQAASEIMGEIQLVGPKKILGMKEGGANGNEVIN